ncbi:MAG: amino acid adenylation domain-containing protein, partial [bacterium]|nr:amino acid adenylation domain-containing protein [bacterium]
NFFELGGHSLLATQVISRVREVFGVELAVQKLFEAPTVARLAAVVEAAAGEARGRTVPPIRPLAREEGILREAVPLSFAQQRLWFIDQLEPGSPMYNMASALRLSGRLDAAVLARSLNEIIRRHEALRTRFTNVGGRPVQVIARALELVLAEVDLRGLVPQAREAEARQLATAEARRPFDLSRGPLLRAIVVRLAGEEYVVLFTMHHIVSDGWSMGVLIRELTVLYAAFSEGNPSPLGELAVQYADYAVWQQQWLSGEVLEEDLAYWREHLAGVGRLELVCDRPRPVVQSFRGSARPFALPAELSEALVRLSREHGVTLFMTLLAGFKALLARYTGQDDPAVGSPIAGRSRREIEELIGFFVNTLVLRTDLSGNPSFQELLERVRRTALDAYAHQHIPFERLVEELEPERDLSSTPLFQVMIALQNAPQAAFELPGLTLRPAASEGGGTARFDLTWLLQESPLGVMGTVEYCTDLFDETTIERLFAHYQRLLAAAVADPGERLRQLPWWTQAERHQLLAEWNDTDAPATAAASIAELVAVQAGRTPERVALVCGEKRVSYAELERRVNRTAHYLQGLGAGPEVPVGMAIERSVDLIVAMLGVFRSGGFLVPLDRTLPADRLSFIIADAGVELVLTRRDSHHHLPAHGARTLLLEEQREAIARQPETSPASGPAAENLAYLIYTSGTTGRPKGISMTHRVLTNLTEWVLRDTAPDAGPRIPQFAPLSFDIIFQETFSALCAGGTLLLLTEEERRDAVLLVDRLERHGIERLHLPFIALQQLCEVASDKPPRALREVITAGEQLQVSRSLQRFFSNAACTLENQYGPSECHVVSYYPLRGAAREWTALPPIGRGIGNFRVYLLDSGLRPVPVGVPGEVCLSGAGMARGYLKRPELTAAAFIPDPWSGDPWSAEPDRRTAGNRLYRTGDLARFLADGNLEFMGRIDLQVKIRGYRIELGEIETVLGAHPGVREAVVVVREDAPGADRRLVAYAVPTPEAELDAGQLRGYLAQSLPDYMVPPAVVFLDSLPWTPGGKVDRKALPAPERRGPEEGYAAPVNPTEELLAGIWAAVLDFERVGVDDNFFELGGHSLLATQVISRVREVFGV